MGGRRERAPAPSPCRRRPCAAGSGRPRRVARAPCASFPAPLPSLTLTTASEPGRPPPRLHACSNVLAFPRSSAPAGGCTMTRKQRPSRRDVLKGGAALLVAGLSGGRAQAEAQTPREKELYEAAQKEGALTWYMSHSNDVTAQALGRGFEAKYPGIKVSAVRTTAQVAFQRVSQEIKAGAMQVDVLSSTDVGHSVHLKEKGLLDKYVPENASKISDVYKDLDPDGYSFDNSAELICICYISSKLDEPDAPKNSSDLLDPKWPD